MPFAIVALVLFSAFKAADAGPPRTGVLPETGRTDSSTVKASALDDQGTRILAKLAAGTSFIFRRYSRLGSFLHHAGQRFLSKWRRSRGPRTCPFLSRHAGRFQYRISYRGDVGRPSRFQLENHICRCRIWTGGLDFSRVYGLKQQQPTSCGVSSLPLSRYRFNNHLGEIAQTFRGTSRFRRPVPNFPRRHRRRRQTSILTHPPVKGPPCTS